MISFQNIKSLMQLSLIFFAIYFINNFSIKAEDINPCDEYEICKNAPWQRGLIYKTITLPNYPNCPITAIYRERRCLPGLRYEVDLVEFTIDENNPNCNSLKNDLIGPTGNILQSKLLEIKRDLLLRIASEHWGVFIKPGSSGIQVTKYVAFEAACNSFSLYKAKWNEVRSYIAANPDVNEPVWPLNWFTRDVLIFRFEKCDGAGCCLLEIQKRLNLDGTEDTVVETITIPSDANSCENSVIIPREIPSYPSQYLLFSTGCVTFCITSE